MLKQRIGIVCAIALEAIRSIYHILHRFIAGKNWRRTPTISNALLRAAGVRSMFDGAHAMQLRMAYDEIDQLIASVTQAEVVILSRQIVDKPRHAMAIALLQKSINDLIATVETLRMGYLSVSLSTMRSALEAHSMSMLITVDRNIYKQYADGRFSTQDAFQKVLRRRDIVTSAEGRRKLENMYRALSMMVHPTANSLVTHLKGQNKAIAIGGFYDSGKCEAYSQHIANISIAAANMRHTITSAYIQPEK